MPDVNVLTVVGANIAVFASIAGLFFWSRAESRADHRLVIQLISSIEKEMKDFHGRLCEIQASRNTD